MSHRLQVLIPEEMEARLTEAAQREDVSKGEWVRRALEEALRRDIAGFGDPLGRLASLEGPTADIDEMNAETLRGRGR